MNAAVRPTHPTRQPTLQAGDADRLVAEPAARDALDASIARRHAVVPIALLDGWQGVGTAAPPGDGARCLVLAARAPDDALSVDPVRAAIDPDVRLSWRVASRGFIDAAFARVYRAHPTLDALLCADPSGTDRGDEASRVIRLVDALLHEACRTGASDLHLTPLPNGTRVRLRCNGSLSERGHADHGLHAALVQRIKVLGSLDVAECRIPQDGRLLRLIGGEDVAFRISSFPVEGGENVVLRVQDPGRRPASLEALGLPPDDVAGLRELLARPAGLLVVAGPVGSGKTTTLYALLGELDDGTRNLVTLEDPVEYPLQGVVQAAVDPARQLDFGSGARALLRQDPDVLMIGEIRDVATCEVALRAALAGYRVLATVHADDALGGVWRLLDLGADAAGLSTCLGGIVAQRLLARADGTGRFAIVERLALDGPLRHALATGGPTAFASLDAGAFRPGLHAAAREAMRAGRCERAGVERVLGPMVPAPVTPGLLS